MDTLEVTLNGKRLELLTVDIMCPTLPCHEIRHFTIKAIERPDRQHVPGPYRRVGDHRSAEDIID